MKTLEELREEESKKYPDLHVSLWHVKDVLSLTYTDEKKRALTVYFTPEMKMKDVRFKEYRYDKGSGDPYHDAKNLPDWATQIYSDYQATAASSMRETHISGFEVNLDMSEYDR